LSAHNESDAVLVDDGVYKGVDIWGNCGLIWTGKDFMYNGNECGALVFLVEATERLQLRLHDYWESSAVVTSHISDALNDRF
jgi:hypothetical protein